MIFNRGEKVWGTTDLNADAIWLASLDLGYNIYVEYKLIYKPIIDFTQLQKIVFGTVKISSPFFSDQLESMTVTILDFQFVNSNESFIRFGEPEDTS